MEIELDRDVMEVILVILRRNHKSLNYKKASRSGEKMGVVFVVGKEQIK